MELLRAVHQTAAGGTVISRSLAKLQLLSRVHAVVFAYETGLVTPGTT